MNQNHEWHWKNQYKEKIEETLNKISLSLKGRHNSPDTEFKKGITNPHKSKTLPWADKAAEGRRKSGMYDNLNHLKNFEKGSVPWNKGKPMSEMAKSKMVAKLKGRKVWNTGLGIGTPLGTLIRRNDKYVMWRKSIFERDEYTCVLCGLKGAQFHVDHIKPFALICKENEIDSLDKALDCTELWDIKNGRTLCIPCHRKTDTFSGKQQTKLYTFPRLSTTDK